ncbi:MAG: acyl-CoA dehydrogenase family protein [Burkholderiaceae bacterium]
MDFQFTEEQLLLADSVGKLIEKDYDFEARKAVIASASGYSESVWQSIGEMGVLGLAMPESVGGFGMGAMGMFPVMEQIGRGLIVEPVLSTVLAGRLLAQTDAQSDAQPQAELLSQIVAGEKKLAFAHTEPAMHYHWEQVNLPATGSGKDWTLNGDKIVVTHAPMADLLVVSARVSGAAGDPDGLGVFLVDPKQPGVSMKTLRTNESWRAADIQFTNAKAIALGSPGKAAAAIDDALDFATIMTCAEGIGAMNYANESTLEYLKTRKQFGTTIGSFQVLQHRMVDMTICAEQARSITYLACDAIDQCAAGEMPVRERQRIVSAAKIKTSDACRQVGQEAIQLHGGMGMTDEMKVSHTFKRLTMISQLFGDAEHHLERFAATDS